MKTKHIGFLLGFLFLATTAFSQDYVFKVLANKGQNTYKAAGSSDWESLRTGTKLNAGDVVKTSGDCYLALLHSSGKPMELKEAKEYSVDNLSTSMGGSSESGVVRKYADYVMSKMTPEEREENRKKYASITGATERGFEQIKLFMQTSADVYNKEAIIRWKGQESVEEYQVTLMDMFEEVLMVAETKDTYIKVNLEDERLSETDLVIVTVKVKGDEGSSSGLYSIQRLETDEVSRFAGDIEELKTALDPTSPINNLILAEFYEQNGLLLDALTSYETAMRQSPDVNYFKEAYTEFLMRNQWTDKLEQK